VPPSACTFVIRARTIRRTLTLPRSRVNGYSHYLSSIQFNLVRKRCGNTTQSGDSMRGFRSNAAVTRAASNPLIIFTGRERKIARLNSASVARTRSPMKYGHHGCSGSHAADRDPRRSVWTYAHQLRGAWCSGPQHLTRKAAIHGDVGD